MTPTTKPRLNWRMVELTAMEPGNLPRAIAGLGFTSTIGPVPRGALPEFAPRYYRFRPLRTRLAAADAIASRGVPGWDYLADGRAVRADWFERRRVAAINRELFTRPCRLLMRDRLGVLFDEVTGEWRHHAGGARGDSIIDLAAMMLGIPYGKAGYRLARLCGLDGVPEMPDA
jgi:hypothetical protein